MHALVRFAHIATGDTFTAHDLHAPATAALGVTTDQYRLASVRYDLSRLRAKGLVETRPHTRQCRLLAEGCSICLVFLKLFERGRASDGRPPEPDRRRCVAREDKRHQLDRLYQRIVDELDTLLRAVGLKSRRMCVRRAADFSFPNSMTV